MARGHLAQAKAPKGCLTFTFDTGMLIALERRKERATEAFRISYAADFFRSYRRSSTSNGGVEGATFERKAWQPWSLKTCRPRFVAPPGRHSAPSKERPSRMQSSWRLPRYGVAASSARLTPTISSNSSATSRLCWSCPCKFLHSRRDSVACARDRAVPARRLWLCPRHPESHPSLGKSPRFRSRASRPVRTFAPGW